MMGATGAMMADSGKVQPPTKIPNAITRVMSWGYRLGIGFQNRRFDRGSGVTRLDMPVISIGNLSAGGTGKTPMVHWVANELQAMGNKPTIAMRGYKAPPGEMGDEEREHHEALLDVPVVAQPNRIAGLQALFETDPEINCVILDDGFQHRQLARDVDIVLIDASHPPYEDALLPRGYLRDPPSSLARADSIVISHAEMVNTGQLKGLQDWIEAMYPQCPLAITEHRWGTINRYSLADGDWVCEQVLSEELISDRLVGVCGIGNPDGFFGQIGQSGLNLVGKIVLRDHAQFDPSAINLILQYAQSNHATALCMTRKDWVKARDRLRDKSEAQVEQFQVIVPELGLFFRSGDQAIRGILKRALGSGISGS